MKCQGYYLREPIKHFAFYPDKRGTAGGLLKWLWFRARVYDEDHLISLRGAVGITSLNFPFF